MKAMLDTDTCIFAMSDAEGFEPQLPLQDCAISVVVLGELEWGVRRSQRVERNQTGLDEWLTAVQVTGMNADVGRHYGTLRAHLAAAGELIGPNDLWIAAHALSLEVPLISHNLREFERVPGLAVETWMRRR